MDTKNPPRAAPAIPSYCEKRRDYLTPTQRLWVLCFHDYKWNTAILEKWYPKRATQDDVLSDAGRLLNEVYSKAGYVFRSALPADLHYALEEKRNAITRTDDHSPGS